MCVDVTRHSYSKLQVNYTSKYSGVLTQESGTYSSLLVNQHAIVEIANDQQASLLDKGNVMSPSRASKPSVSMAKQN